MKKLNNKILLFSLTTLLLLPFFLNAKVKIYYYYDPLKDGYVFTNTCNDYRKCKPLLVTKGKVKHKNSFHYSKIKEQAYDSIIKKASQKYNLDFYLIKSLIKAESLFDSNAISSKGASGLMQLMPTTAKSLGVSNAFDPEQNIMAGTKYLKKLIKRFKNVKLALASYNAGAVAVIFYGGVPPFEETQKYVKKISKYYFNYTKRKLF